MRRRIESYLFDKNAATITFSGPLSLEQILMITDVSASGEERVLYNFADSSLGGSIVGNVLTLATDTSGLNNADKLQIFIDEPNTDFAELTDILKYGIVDIS